MIYTIIKPGLSYYAPPFMGKDHGPLVINVLCYHSAKGKKCLSRIGSNKLQPYNQAFSYYAPGFGLLVINVSCYHSAEGKKPQFG